jgi:hypothetical protein
VVHFFMPVHGENVTSRRCGRHPFDPTSAVKMESRELENAPSHLSKEVSINEIQHKGQGYIFSLPLRASSSLRVALAHAGAHRCTLNTQEEREASRIIEDNGSEFAL